MLTALRGVLRECWHAQLLTTDEYQAATSIRAVRGESEARRRDLCAGELFGRRLGWLRRPASPHASVGFTFLRGPRETAKLRRASDHQPPSL